MHVNKWDGMRPTSPNFIHRAWSWCHIPPVGAMSGAKSYLLNVMGFVANLPFAVTLPSLSYRPLSPHLHLLTTYRLLGFIVCLHRSPSLVSTVRQVPPSSLFVVAIYSLVLQCNFNASCQLQLLMKNKSICLNDSSMPHTPCTLHHLEAQP